MPLVIAEESVFNCLVIRGGSRGVTLMVSLGIKFDIIFRKIFQ